MEIKKFEINGKEFTFICKSDYNRRGFYHEVVLSRDKAEIGINKVQYYNRTWECYQFQSAMRGCISKIQDKTILCYIDNYKRSMNINRLSKELKARLINRALEDIEEARDLNELYKKL